VTPAPLFSVVITTRNRPGLFSAALASVLMQEQASFEVLVVDDGSSDALRAEYDAIEHRCATEQRPVRFIHLKQTAAGHGPSHALNTGARQASGRYLCFLDDDDVWTEPGHLHRAKAILDEAGDQAELLMFDQAAFRGDVRLTEAVWLEALGRRLRAAGPAPVAGSYPVNPDQLMTATGFCHVNTTVIEAGLFRRLRGQDEALRYENDRDFYLRAIDQAALILYCPEVVARHNVPEASRTVNASTRANPVYKALCQFSLLNRAALTARHPAIRRHGREHRRYALQKAWVACRRAADYRQVLVGVAAASRQALLHRFGRMPPVNGSLLIHP